MVILRLSTTVLIHWNSDNWLDFRPAMTIG